MELRTLVGAYAGQVRNFPEHIAKQLLADGRAVRPEVDLQATVPEVPAPALRTAVAPAKRKRR